MRQACAGWAQNGVRKPTPKRPKTGFKPDFSPVAKIAVFEPRPTEARTFIFLYVITPMLL